MTDRATETFKSLVSISTEALKSLLLLNGGAIVALLAYLGQSGEARASAHFMRSPLAFFTVGLLLAALAFCTAYLTQLALYNEDGLGPDFKGIRHHVWLRLTLAFGIGSLAAFAIGAFATIRVLGA
jgi:hypothetical protein